MAKKKEITYIAQADGELSTGKKFKSGDEFAKCDLEKEDFDALREMAAIATAAEIEKAEKLAASDNAEVLKSAIAELPPEIIEEEQI